MPTGLLIAAIPGTIVLLAALLALSGLVEQHFLSPRSLILSVARARRNTPEYAEAFVARQLDRLLLEQAGRSAIAERTATRPAASWPRRRRGRSG